MIKNVVDDGNNAEVQLCINTGIGENDSDLDDNKGTESDDDEEPDSAMNA
jgi:hypothetical protein